MFKEVITILAAILMALGIASHQEAAGQPPDNTGGLPVYSNGD